MPWATFLSFKPQPEMRTSTFGSGLVPGRGRVVCERCSKTAQHSTAQQPEMLTSVVGSSLVSGRG
jgi:hypothetical protein